MNQDQEHLNMLAVFHYLIAGAVMLLSLWPIADLVIGLVIALFPTGTSGTARSSQEVMGLVFLIPGLLSLFFIWFCAAIFFYTGRCLKRRKHSTFCLVVAFVECAFVPLGTILGVFSIIVLTRDSVKPLFAGAQPVAKV
jgi:type III secretory pathway component EscS